MMKRHRRCDTALVAGREHPPVVVERGAGELAVFGFDARPLDREPVGAEAETRTIAMSSAYRLRLSQQSPDTPTHGVLGACSHAHQSLFQLPPSIWWAAPATPHTKPSGNVMLMNAEAT